MESPLNPATVNDQQSKLNRTRLPTWPPPGPWTRCGRPCGSPGGGACPSRSAAVGTRWAASSSPPAVSCWTSRPSTRSTTWILSGLVTVEAGIFWPALMEELDRRQPDADRPWCIRQKQTGVDRVSLGGSLAANAHGRGHTLPPLVEDVEAFTLMDAAGHLHHCSRTENAERFALAIGGYGCFGLLLDVTLRLVRRQTVQRRVQPIAVADLIPLAEQQLDAGALYGDCQYASHLQDPADQHAGLFSCYHPVAGPPDPVDPDLSLSAQQWTDLIRLARQDKPRAFDLYRQHYLNTDGRKYASDRHQLSPVFDGYLAAVRHDPGQTPATEMITEVYVAPDRLMDLLAACRRDFVQHGVDMTYGTIRLIEPDTQTYLPWATQRWACIVVNLHVKHDPAELDRVRRHFLRILDRTLEHDGSFYLTYHRWAHRRHLEAA